MSVVLIVEDVPALREQYAYDLRRLAGHDTLTAADGDEALAILESEPVDCVILDLEMPGTDGFEVLRRLRARDNQVPVIVYTGTGNYDRCVQAVKLGAWGFVDKTEPLERVLHEIENALAHGRLAAEVAVLRRRLDTESSLIGESAPLQAVRDAIAKLAPIPSPVLIVGESGTGKELVARDLHRLGPRAREPFLAVNCAALPENLVESELFGHEKGAFTGADRLRRGAFESAQKGTLLLDEIAEMPSAVQAKLLRVLEDERVTRLGGNRSTPIDCRVLAATNRDLEKEVAAGRFRDDLLFRLNVHTLNVPPLRERKEDIPALVAHFLATIAERFGARRKRIAAQVVAELTTYDWRRNNVRELRNVVERMILASSGEEIDTLALPAEVRKSPGVPGALHEAVDESQGTFRDLKEAAERRIITAALDRNEWHLTRTAAELGLSDHASLAKIMRRLGIRRK
jgi:two-component system nitrogen regulation response regulator NtrX